jgi:hypothetical protein
MCQVDEIKSHHKRRDLKINNVTGNLSTHPSRYPLDSSWYGAHQLPGHSPLGRMSIGPID